MLFYYQIEVSDFKAIFLECFLVSIFIKPKCIFVWLS